MKHKVIGILFIIIIFSGAILAFFNEKPLIHTERAQKKQSAFFTNLVLKCNDIYNKDYILKGFMSDLYVGLQGLIGKKIIDDSDSRYVVYEDKNENLHFIYPKVDVSRYANNMKDLKEYLDAKDIDLIYVSTPFKVIEGYTKLPCGSIDYTNNNADEFLSKLKDYGLPFIDLRNIKLAENKDLFYRTDHHWTIETAVEATNYLIQKLDIFKRKFIFNKSNLMFSTSKRSFLGSQGKRVGSFYAKKEDFTKIIPIVSMDFEIYNSMDKIMSSGSFGKCFIREAKANSFEYGFYNEFYENRIINKNPINNTRIMIVKDSFALPIVPLLAINAKELYVIDLRSEKRNLISKIDEVNPDIVMFLYCPHELAGQYAELMYTFRR